MIFVPLPLFASLALAVLAIHFSATRDMGARAHQLFAAVIALYAVQSFLVTLRWGYAVEAAALPMALIAPVLPVLAVMAYGALKGRARGIWRQNWPVLAIPINWMILVLAPGVADAAIPLTYAGFGVLLLMRARHGPDRLTLPPVGSLRMIIAAMALTGLTMIASALTDIYLIVDFIRNDGRNIALIITVMQTGFVLLIGCAATFGRASAEPAPGPAKTPPPSADEIGQDPEIIARIEALFDTEALHRREDISLRKLSRRLHLPDRRVSNAINRGRGQSVSQFVNDRRIRDACDMLRSTDETILDISLHVGFATKSNFNREFGRVTGSSPSDWRKANA